MVCKMLLFDFREIEQPFFNKNYPENYDITFYYHSLNDVSIAKLSDRELEETNILSVYKTSVLNEKVLEKFKNLRVIALRTDNYENVDLKTCLVKNIAVLNVEYTKNDNEYSILLKSFKDITDVFCGCRKKRLV